MPTKFNYRQVTGAERIQAERDRQIEKEGWTSEHDKQHTDYELTKAAVCYAQEAMREGFFSRFNYPTFRNSYWPWHQDWWKPSPKDKGIIAPKDSIRMLEKAGALIAAEIDRLLGNWRRNMKMAIDEIETDYTFCHYYEPNSEDFEGCPGNIFIEACRRCPCVDIAKNIS